MIQRRAKLEDRLRQAGGQILANFHEISGVEIKEGKLVVKITHGLSPEDQSDLRMYLHENLQQGDGLRPKQYQLITAEIQI